MKKVLYKTEVERDNPICFASQIDQLITETQNSGIEERVERLTKIWLYQLIVAVIRWIGLRQGTEK